MSCSSVSWSSVAAVAATVALALEVIGCSGAGGGGQGGQGGQAAQTGSAGSANGGTTGGGGAPGGTGGTAGGSQGGAGGRAGGGGAGGRGGGAGTICVSPPGTGGRADNVTMKLNGMPTGFYTANAVSYEVTNLGSETLFHLGILARSSISSSDSYVILQFYFPPGMTSGTVACGEPANGEFLMSIDYYDCNGRASNWSGPSATCSATFTQIPLTGQAGRMIGTFTAAPRFGAEITDGVIDLAVEPQDI